MKITVRFLALLVFAPLLGCAAEQEKPLAWVTFNEYLRKTGTHNGRSFFRPRDQTIQFKIDVPPANDHKLAILWGFEFDRVAALGQKRAMKLSVNGKETEILQNPVYTGFGFAWQVIPLAPYQAQNHYDIAMRQSDPLVPMIAEVRLIVDTKQLDSPISGEVHRVVMVYPVYDPVKAATERRKAEEQHTALKLRLAARRTLVIGEWLAKQKMQPRDIQGDEFLHAAVKFADTAVRHGRDTYGKEHTPLFANWLHVDVLKSPRGRVLSSDTAPCPSVLCFFQNQQNLLRLLASLSSLTGDEKHVGAAYDATAFMYERYWSPRSGLFHWGGHGHIDLVSGGQYGSKGISHEIEDVYPFWDFLLAVDPQSGERTVKGMWEGHIRDWTIFSYNRHGSFDAKPDFSQTWNRRWEVAEPRSISGLSFVSVALDLGYGAYALGFAEKQEEPVLWANRMFDYIIKQRDPKTKMWPNLVNPNSARRGEHAYGDAYPQATEQKLFVGGNISAVPRFHLGALASVEIAKKHGASEKIQKLHEAVEDWVIGYLNAAYDPETHTMKSIISDGTDVTDYVFPRDGYFGAKKGTSLSRVRVGQLFHAVIARAYRLSEREEAKAKMWIILRQFFKGAKLGQLGETPGAQPVLNYGTEAADPGYVFALVDLFRATKNREYLKFAEHIGRNIIKVRQHPNSGLFTLEDSAVPQHGRKRKVAYLDAMEPLAVLSIYAARSGQLDKAPTWVGGGLNGSGDDGHMAGADLELWFEGKEAVKASYRKMEGLFQALGLEVDELGPEWFPEE